MPHDERGLAPTSLHNLQISVAIDRLEELLPAIRTDLGHLTIAFGDEDLISGKSDLTQLLAFDANFWADQLIETLSLVAGYLRNIGLGPDADAALVDARRLQEKIRDFGVSLIADNDLRSEQSIAQQNANRSAHREQQRLIEIEVLIIEGLIDKFEERLNSTKSSFAVTTGDEGPWSEPKSPKQWTKVFNMSWDALKKRFDNQGIRNKKLSIKSYQVHRDDMPHPK